MKDRNSESSISKQKLKRIAAVELQRLPPEEQKKKELLYNSRPFVLCGLPVKRPRKEVLVHERRNGKFRLRIVGDPILGLPFGQDRLIPLWVSTLAVKQQSRLVTFRSGAEILEIFDLPKDGPHYKRLVDGFKRIFNATIFFGEENDLVYESGRFHFFDHIRIWTQKAQLIQQQQLPGEFENSVLLSEAFWKELQAHPIPVDLDMVRAFANAPGLLDFYTWWCWRQWRVNKTRTTAKIPIQQLIGQLGISERTTTKEFKRTLGKWIKQIQQLNPDAGLVVENSYLVLVPSSHKMKIS